MITERLMSSGQWSVTLSADTPLNIVHELGVAKSGFAHIVITPNHVTPTDFTDSGLLGVARYTGVYRKRSGRVLSGAGLATWLGDESGKGDVLTSPTAHTTFSGWIGALRPAYFTAGVTSSIAGTFVQTYQRVTRRKALDEVCAFYDAEWRVRPDFTFDAGTRAALFLTTPRAVVVKRKADSGTSAGYTGISGDLEVDEDTESWARAVLYYFDSNQQLHQPDGGVADADVPFRNPTGGAAQVRQVVESSTPATGEAAGLASAEYSKVRDIQRTLTLTADHYDIGADVTVGDDLWVYDPDAGLVDTANQIEFRGETIFPTKIRCVGYTWPVRLGMGVYLRRYVKVSGVWTVDWIDLTEYVEWETGDGQVEVGALPRPSSSAATQLQSVSSAVSSVVDRFGQLIEDCNLATIPGDYLAVNATNAPIATGIGALNVIPGGTGVRRRQTFQRIFADAGVLDVRRWIRDSADSGVTWDSWTVIDERDTGWLTTGVSITAATGWSLSSYRVRRIGTRVTGSVTLSRSGASITPAASGDVSPDVDVFTMPSGWLNGSGQARMQNSSRVGVTPWLSSINTSSVVQISGGAPGTTITTSSTFVVDLDYYTD